MSKGSQQAPDYTGAAEKTAAGNLANLNAQTVANRPDMITPWGTSTWKQNGDQWINTVSLSPAEQASLNSQQRVQTNQSTLAEGLQGQVRNTMAGGFQAPTLSDYTSSLPGVRTGFIGFTGNTPVNTNAPQFSDASAAAGAKAAYGASTSLLQDGWDQANKKLDVALRLQGLQPGTEAYNTAVQNQQRTQAQQQNQLADEAVRTGNDMANQNYASTLSGFAAGNAAQGQKFGQALQGYGANTAAQEASNAAQQQAYQQAMQNFGTAYSTGYQNYMQPLNSMNAVLTGNQVQNPAFNGFSQSGYTPGADYSGATSALGQWNSGQAAQQGSIFGNILGAGAKLGSAYITASDARLKTNIRRIGRTRQDRHNWYEWQWKDSGRTARGVIAQEIAKRIPAAVIRGPDGFLRVNYAMLS